MMCKQVRVMKTTMKMSRRTPVNHRCCVMCLCTMRDNHLLWFHHVCPRATENQRLFTASADGGSNSLDVWGCRQERVDTCPTPDTSPFKSDDQNNNEVTLTFTTRKLSQFMSAFPLCVCVCV